MIDGAFIYHLAAELKDALVGARIDKIIQVNEETFLFQCYLRGQTKHLIIDLNTNRFSAYLTRKTQTSAEHTQFLQHLRKHLLGAINVDIKQHITDRVIIFAWRTMDLIDGAQEKWLVFEAMGKHSNLLLVHHNKIVDSFKKMFFTTGRQLLPGAEFSFFPIDKKPFTTIDYSTMMSPKMLTQSYMGLSSFLATYLFDHHYQINDLPLDPTMDLTKNKVYWTDLFPVNHQKKKYSSLSLLLDNVERDHQQYKQSYEIFLDKMMKKTVHKMAELEKDRHHHQKGLLKKADADFIYQSGLTLTEKYSSINMDAKTILLDPTKTLNENAQKFYKDYHKAKRGLTFVEQQVKENEALLSHLTSLKAFLSWSKKTDINDLEKDLIELGYRPKQKQQPRKKRPTKPHLTTITDTDAQYFIGKNHLQNAYVTHELAHPNDYFFHVKDAPGSHVVVRTEQLTEPILRKAAMLAAYFSSYRFSSSIPVDYTLIRHVRKIPRTLGHQVLLRQYQTIYIDIDEDLIQNYL